MNTLTSGELSAIDIAALVWFLICWGGYNWFASSGLRATRSLVGASHHYRLQWAKQLLIRENRVADSSLVGNLMSSVSFYANTTIYVIAGLMALWSALDQTMGIISELPFARHSARPLWELRLVLLIFVFVFAYFKFTWALREFNLLSIMIGGAPDFRTVAASEHGYQAYALKMAAVNSLAGEEFNRGVRSYYFGLAALAWFIQPWLFIGATTLVVVVLYRRDYTSPLLKIVLPD
jgi:uncharacterized membrane protein